MAVSRQVSSAILSARQILRELSIESPDEIEVEDIAWNRGALVQEASLEGADGRLVRSHRRGIISIRADIPEPQRKRFVVAHELGHFELHADRDQLALCLEEHFVYWYRRARPEEPEANEFATELLMPESLFRPRCESHLPGFDLIERLAEEFRTSLTATALRCAGFSSHRCSLVVSHDTKVKWVARSPGFRYWIDPGTPLHRDTYAIDLLAGKSIPLGMQSVPASAWLGSKKVRSTAIIKEESKLLPRYSTVLTLLWIDRDIGGGEDDEEEEEKPEYDPDHFTPDGRRWRW